MDSRATNSRTCRLLLLLLLSIARIWSVAGSVDASSTFDYKDALTKSLLFLQAQRSGKLPDDQTVTWRADSGLTDGSLANVDLVGGYYDAGDNIKFGMPMAFTVTMLAWSALEYSSQLTQAGEMQNLQDAIRWGTDYLIKAHTAPNQLWVQVGAPKTDHNCWERPEDMDTPRTLLQVNATSPGSEVAGETAAAMAAASIVFRSTDAEYAEQLVNHASQLFLFADTYRGNFTGACPFYCSYSGFHVIVRIFGIRFGEWHKFMSKSNRREAEINRGIMGNDELLWASAWLYKATEISSYLQYVIDNKNWVSNVIEFNWENKVAGLQVMMSKLYFSGQSSLKSFKTQADAFLCSNLPSSPSRQTKTTPGGLLYIRIGSNTQYGINMAFLASLYTEYLSTANINQIMCGNITFTLNDIDAFASSQADYILGDNPLGISYMVGFGENYPQQAHHRGASIKSIHELPSPVTCSDGFNDWYSKNASNPNILIGAIVGGPNTMDEFDDQRSDSSCTEPCTYVNAPFVGITARMAYKKLSSLTQIMSVD